MKKIVISAIVIVLTTCGLFAQDVRFGMRGGLNMAGMPVAKSTPASEDFKMRMAPAWGIFTELQVNQTFSLRLGVEYSGMGGKKEGMQAMPTQRIITQVGSSFGLAGMTEEQMAGMGMLAMSLPHYYYADVETTVKFDYVTIPILAQFGRDIGTSPWRVYVNAGPSVSFILSTKQVSKGTSKLFADANGANTLWGAMPEAVQFVVAGALPDVVKTLDEPVKFGETNITGELKSVNLGVTAHTGIRYQYKNNFFFLEFGGNWGFLTVQEKDTTGSNRIGAASLTVGYAFSL